MRYFSPLSPRTLVPTQKTPPSNSSEAAPKRETGCCLSTGAPSSTPTVRSGESLKSIF